MILKCTFADVRNRDTAELIVEINMRCAHSVVAHQLTREAPLFLYIA